MLRTDLLFYINWNSTENLANSWEICPITWSVVVTSWWLQFDWSSYITYTWSASQITTSGTWVFDFTYNDADRVKPWMALFARWRWCAAPTRTYSMGIISNWRIVFDYSTDGTNSTWLTSGNNVITSWQRNIVVMTLESNTLKLYNNGVLKYTWVLWWAIFNAAQPRNTYIWRDYCSIVDANLWWFKWTMRQVRIYSWVFTQADVTTFTNMQLAYSKINNFSKNDLSYDSYDMPSVWNVVNTPLSVKAAWGSIPSWKSIDELQKEVYINSWIPRDIKTRVIISS